MKLIDFAHIKDTHFSRAIENVVGFAVLPLVLEDGKIRLKPYSAIYDRVLGPEITLEQETLVNEIVFYTHRVMQDINKRLEQDPADRIGQETV